MKTKKLIAGFLAAATAATMASSIIVSAADGSLTVSNTKAKAGESFTLTVDLAGIPDAGMNGCDFAIQFDSSIVSVSSVTKGDMVPEASADEVSVSDPLTTTIGSGSIGVLYAVADTDPKYYLKGSGTFLTITGTVSADANAGDKADFKIVANTRNDGEDGTIENGSFYFGLIDENDDVTVYSPTITDGYVEVLAGDVDPSEGSTDPSDAPTDPPTAPSIEIDHSKATRYGDVDCNDLVEIADVVTLNKYLIDSTSVTITDAGFANADVAKDNSLDINDSGKIIDFLARVIGEDDLGV